MLQVWDGTQLKQNGSLCDLFLYIRLIIFSCTKPANWRLIWETGKFRLSHSVEGKYYWFTVYIQLKCLDFQLEIMPPYLFQQLCWGEEWAIRGQIRWKEIEKQRNRRERERIDKQWVTDGERRWIVETITQTDSLLNK